MMAIYFLCEPLVPALTTFGLVAHTIVSLAILGAIMVYAVMTDTLRTIRFSLKRLLIYNPETNWLIFGLLYASYKHQVTINWYVT